jgi:hypothetical protein
MSAPKWEVIERQTQGETFWDVTNGFWTLTVRKMDMDMRRLVATLNCIRRQGPGYATRSIIACAEDALSFVVGGSGPARRKRVTDSLRGTVENARRLLGDS